MSVNGEDDYGGSSMLPPDLFDKTTLVSLASTVLILLTAYALSVKCLSPATARPLRVLFIWHAFDALIHFFLEGSFLYHCFFSWIPTSFVLETEDLYYPTAFNYLGTGADRVYGPQSAPDNPFSQLWMVYARADKRWAGADLTVISLELLTVFAAGPLACYICYLISKQDHRAYLWMIIVATGELYGGFMTFCPEWLTGNVNLDTSNWMYLWLYLIFFNTLWVFIPLYAIYVSWGEITKAFNEQASVSRGRARRSRADILIDNLDAAKNASQAESHVAEQWERDEETERYLEALGHAAHMQQT
ncbi:emopamil binding protein [Zalerion maritima]|uniref:Emopamil binding protein n=1 Tax=Zalerion maritima TaxID=339359 RepID=A0AAD5S097_9PEZI|nr:emopamil binding protein [Zalerion maritima]